MTVSMDSPMSAPQSTPSPHLSSLPTSQIFPIHCGYCINLKTDPQREVCDHFILHDKFAAPVAHRESSPDLLSESLMSSSEKLASASGQREITKLRQALLVLSHKQNHLQRKLNAFRGQQIEIADRECWNFDVCQALLGLSDLAGGILFPRSPGITKEGMSVSGRKGKAREIEGDPGFVMPIFKEGESMLPIPNITCIVMTKTSHQDPFPPVENFVETANTVDDLFGIELTPSRMFACPCFELLQQVYRSHARHCLLKSPSPEKGVTPGQ
jgi:hypothetical protein